MRFTSYRPGSNDLFGSAHIRAGSISKIEAIGLSKRNKISSSAGQRIKKGILYAKEIGPLPDVLFSPPQSEEQCCELDRSTARFLALESHREALAYDYPVFIR
jgi:hypothetical protein